MYTVKEMTHTLHNQREDVFYLPHPLPPAEDRFTPFSNPGPEGLDLSQEKWRVGW